MPKNQQKNIFLDFASVTPVDKRVEKEIIRVQKKFWGNPSSLHKFGEEAKEILENSRIKIARIFHTKSSEVFFTSGGTESLNLAILGSATFFKSKTGLLPHFILSSIEHPAILEPVRAMVKKGEAEASFVSPDSGGCINPNSIKKEIKPNTVLVALSHANSEIGVLQPISKISLAIKEYKRENDSKYPYFLVDASQSFLYEDVSIERLGSDMLVADGIKAYGPRGAGILIVKNGVNLEPIIYGGGHEGGLRAGTENVPSAAGLAVAFEVGAGLWEKESKRLLKIRDYAISKIIKEVPNASLNGSLKNRLPNNINICFPGFEAEFLVIKLDVLGFAVSGASACASLKLDGGSHVIEALGPSNNSGQANRECKNSSLRITLGRETKKQDLDKFIKVLKKVVA